MRDRFPDPGLRAALKLEDFARRHYRIEGATWKDAIAGPLVSAFERGGCE
jgi:hypothetical protein